MAKSTKAVAEQRLDEIHTLLLRNFTRREIIAYCNKKGWGIAPSTVSQYIRKANKIIYAASDKTREAFFNKTLKQYEDLYKLAVMKKDYNAARNVQTDISKLMHLDRVMADKDEAKGEFTITYKPKADVND